MTRERILPLLLALPVAACTPQVNVEAERGGILAADRAWSETPPDVDRFVSYFTGDGLSLVGNAPPAEGLAAIRSDVSELFGSPGFALSWSASRADVSACGDLAYTIGSYEITLADPAGNPVTRPGKYLTVWKKQADGQWKVAVDAPSENEPPPAATALLELAQDSVEVDPQHSETEVTLETEDALYALGFATGSSLRSSLQSSFYLEEEDFGLLELGLHDAISGRDAQVKMQDFQAQLQRWAERAEKAAAGQ